MTQEGSPRTITNRLPPDGLLEGGRWPMTDCARCIGACCLKNTQLPLTGAEAAQMLERGALLERGPNLESEAKRGLFRRRKTNDSGQGMAAYTLLSDCPNLDGDNRCTVHDESSPARPQACDDLFPGTHICISAQRKVIKDGRAQHVPSKP